MIRTFSATLMVSRPCFDSRTELGPSGRYSLLSALEREFGESYPVAVPSFTPSWRTESACCTTCRDRAETGPLR